MKIEDLVKAHGDRRIWLFEIAGQSIFPVTGASGGIMACAMVYLAAGFLDPGDLGRGARTHSHGHSWGFEIERFDPLSIAGNVQDELRKFSAYLDEKAFR